MGTERARVSVSGNQISMRPATGTTKTKSSFSVRRTSNFSSLGSFIRRPPSLGWASTDITRIGRRARSLMPGIRNKLGGSSRASVECESLIRVSASSVGTAAFGATRYLPRTTMRNQHSIESVPPKCPDSQKSGGIQTRSSSSAALCSGSDVLPIFPKTYSVRKLRFAGPKQYYRLTFSRKFPYSMWHNVALLAQDDVGPNRAFARLRPWWHACILPDRLG
jgi:hypothetical protein